MRLCTNKDIYAKKEYVPEGACKMDPYVLIQYGNQERKSKVAREQGKNPVWNEKLTFKVEYPMGATDQHKITFRIMDKDTFSADDFVGESEIYAKDVVSIGMEKGTSQLPPSKYRVVLANMKYYGEIRVGVTFTRTIEDEKAKDFGGWKLSSYP
ncbi:hypothetical protein IFM89_015963 [Coptis chinensis]|uniref:C2 domain-containing protein n=1 Tax=Coptis chinensis TaxID=261450 RepID=A0A835HD46_9MAGN|nr:hypothetical protein IFM89_015963 [Coptis chinensis]